MSSVKSAAAHTPGAMRAAMELFPDNQGAFDQIGHRDDPGLAKLYEMTWNRMAEIIDRETAAPEMLEALEALVTDPVVSGQSAHIRDTARRDGRIIDPYEQARAAIQKARGGQ